MTEVLRSGALTSAPLRPLPHSKQKISITPCRFYLLLFARGKISYLVWAAVASPLLPERMQSSRWSMKEIEQWTANLTGVLTVIVLLCSFILSFPNLRYASEISLIDPVLTSGVASLHRFPTCIRFSARSAQFPPGRGYPVWVDRALGLYRGKYWVQRRGESGALDKPGCSCYPSDFAGGIG